MGSVESEFEAFVAARWMTLIRTARLISGDRSQAEDLVQAALVQTFTHWGSLRSPAAADAYTHTTMVRLALRSQRRRWRGERPTHPMPEPAAVDQYADRDSADVVRRALAALPVEQRAVLVLRYYVQMTEAEIADVLRCPVGTVKSRANRALAALRDGGLLEATVTTLEAPDD